MAENETGNGAAPQIPQMKILGQFIRDISFENILAQKPVAGQMNPDIQVQVALDGRKGGTDNQYEVISKYNIVSKNKDSDNVLFVSSRSVTSSALSTVTRAYHGPAARSVRRGRLTVNA